MRAVLGKGCPLILILIICSMFVHACHFRVLLLFVRKIVAHHQQHTPALLLKTHLKTVSKWFVSISFGLWDMILEGLEAWDEGEFCDVVDGLWNFWMSLRRSDADFYCSVIWCWRSLWLAFTSRRRKERHRRKRRLCSLVRRLRRASSCSALRTSTHPSTTPSSM